jgi:resolvase-like protein
MKAAWPQSLDYGQHGEGVRKARQSSTSKPRSKVGFWPGGSRSHRLQVALYARVSTHDQQTLPLQIKAMREYAVRRDWQVAAEIKEVVPALCSGPNGRDCSLLFAAASSMRLSSGGWIAGAARLPITFAPPWA